MELKATMKVEKTKADLRAQQLQVDVDKQTALKEEQTKLLVDEREETKRLQKELGEAASALSCLQGQHHTLTQEHTSLTNMHQGLVSTHTSLSSQHGSLADSHSALNTKHDELNSEYIQLKDSHTNTATELEALKTQLTELQLTHEALGKENDARQEDIKQQTKFFAELGKQLEEAEKLHGVVKAELKKANEAMLEQLKKALLVVLAALFAGYMYGYCSSPVAEV